MGTELLASGVPTERGLDLLNLTHPQLVLAVHRSYLSAGAEILKTNSFGANRSRLSAFGLQHQDTAINQASVRLAHQAASGSALVAGSIGPSGGDLTPGIFAAQATTLLEAGADLLLLETFFRLDELSQAIAECRAAGPAAFLLAHVTVQDDASLPDGSSLEQYTRVLDQSSADAIGINCSQGPASLLAPIEYLLSHTTKPVSAIPSAGLPSGYLSAEQMEPYAHRFLDLGVRFLGGCCGATPAHIYRFRTAIESRNPNC